MPHSAVSTAKLCPRLLANVSWHSLWGVGAGGRIGFSFLGSALTMVDSVVTGCVEDVLQWAKRANNLQKQSPCHLIVHRKVMAWVMAGDVLEGKTEGRGGGGKGKGNL